MDTFGSCMKFQRLIHMYSNVKSEAKMVDKEPLFITENYLFMTALIRETPIDKNIASEFIMIYT